MKSQTFNLPPEFRIKVITPGAFAKFLGFSVDCPPTGVRLNRGLKRALLWEKWSLSKACLSAFKFASFLGKPFFFSGGRRWLSLSGRSKAVPSFTYLRGLDQFCWRSRGRLSRGLFHDLLQPASARLLLLFACSILFLFFLPFFQRMGMRWKHFLHLHHQAQQR